MPTVRPFPPAIRAATLAGLLLLGAATAAEAPAPKILIDGVDQALEANIRATLSLSGEPCDAPRRRIQRLFARADGEIRSASRALGHYAVEITQRLERTDECWQAHFTIAPGEPVQIERIDLRISGDGEHDAALTAPLNDSPLRPGSPLHHGHYAALKQALESLASQRGYLDARLEQSRLEVDPERRRARIELELATGPRYRFGAITFAQEAYSEAFLERFRAVASGDPYSDEEVSALYRRLTASGLFTQVDIRPQPDSEAQRVDLLIRLTPRKRFSYRFGIGGATDTGARLSGAFENRRMTRSGHAVQADLLAAQREQALGLEYRIPLFGERTRLLALRAGGRSEQNDAGVSDTYTLGARVSGQIGAWQEVRSLDLRQESSRVGDQRLDQLLLVPGIGWSRTEVDDRLRPRRGWRLGLDLSGAHQSLLSDTSLFHAEGQARWVQGLPWGDARLLLRGNLGAVVSERFRELPKSFRFFAGGDRSVRGFDTEALGPVDDDGEPRGGRYLLTGSIEYEQPFAKSWAVALFYDRGNAFDDLTDRLRSGRGIGLRWFSPVGPLRIDLAFGDADAPDPWRIHFTMGPEF